MLKKFMKRFMKVTAVMLAITFVLSNVPLNMLYAEDGYAEMEPLNTWQFGVNFIPDTPRVVNFSIAEDIFVTNPQAFNTTFFAPQFDNRLRWICVFRGFSNQYFGQVNPMACQRETHFVFDDVRFPNEGIYSISLSFWTAFFADEWPMDAGRPNAHTVASGWMFANFQRTASFVNIAGGQQLRYHVDGEFSTSELENPTTFVRNPNTITVGRPGVNSVHNDTHGEYRHEWRIYRLLDGETREYVTSGGRSDYATTSRTPLSIDVSDRTIFTPGRYIVVNAVMERTPFIPEVHHTLYDDDGNELTGNNRRFPNPGIVERAYGAFEITSDEPTDPPPEEPTYITIRKELRIPDGTALPDEDIEFRFNSNLVDFWPPRAGEELPNVSLSNDDLYATFSPPLTTTTDSGYMYAYVEVPVNLSAINWPHPGIFTFRIYEEVNSSNFNAGNDFSVTYDRTVFYLDVHIGREDPNDMTAPIVVLGVNTSGRIPVAGYENCTGIVNGENCTTCTRIVRDEHEKWELPFTNHLAPSHAIFEVSKTVEGDMSDPNLPFAFTANFTLPDNAPLPTGDNAIVATITGYARVNGIINTSLPRVTESTVSVTSLPHSFNLRHGDIVTFSNMPIGTGFTVTEPNVPGYEQSGVAVAGGVQVDSDTADEGASLILSGTIGILAASGSANTRGVFNYVAVLNELPDEPPMGVFLSNVPFGLMVAIGAGAMVTIGAAAILHSKAKRKR